MLKESTIYIGTKEEILKRLNEEYDFEPKADIHEFVTKGYQGVPPVTHFDGFNRLSIAEQLDSLKEKGLGMLFWLTSDVDQKPIDEPTVQFTVSKIYVHVRDDQPLIQN